MTKTRPQQQSNLTRDILPSHKVQRNHQIPNRVQQEVVGGLKLLPECVARARRFRLVRCAQIFNSWVSGGKSCSSLRQRAHHKGLFSCSWLIDSDRYSGS